MTRRLCAATSYHAGTACTNLQNGAYSNFQFVYACAGVTICIDRKADGTCAD